MIQLLAGSKGSTRSMVGKRVLGTFTRFRYAVSQSPRPERPPDPPWHPEHVGAITWVWIANQEGASVVVVVLVVVVVRLGVADSANSVSLSCLRNGGE